MKRVLFVFLVFLMPCIVQAASIEGSLSGTPEDLSVSTKLEVMATIDRISFPTIFKYSRNSKGYDLSISGSKTKDNLLGDLSGKTMFEIRDSTRAPIKYALIEGTLEKYFIKTAKESYKSYIGISIIKGDVDIVAGFDYVFDYAGIGTNISLKNYVSQRYTTISFDTFFYILTASYEYVSYKTASDNFFSVGYDITF